MIETPAGNFLWDCVALIDDATVKTIEAMGGLVGIAISHPHYYTRCQDWGAAFRCPVYLHAADREWVVRPDPAIVFWDGDTLAMSRELTLIKLGGHFPGAAVLHWRTDTNNDGVLLTGDTLHVVADRNRVTFLWSYPNMIPLSANTVRRIADTLRPWKVDRLYSSSVGRQITHNGSAAIARSAQRYIDLLSEER